MGTPLHAKIDGKHRQFETAHAVAPSCQAILPAGFKNRGDCQSTGFDNARET